MTRSHRPNPVTDLIEARSAFVGFLRVVSLLTIACLVACSSGKPQVRRPSQDGAPIGTVDISKIPEPTPKFEALSRYGNHSPYRVLGKQYEVLPSRAGYKVRGIASWYGTKFHGNLTSNREPYDMYAFSAAHKSLPLPTYARVTNLDTQKSVIVRINDRGPFVDDRVIDLSYVAAIKLGIYKNGTGRVEVEAIDLSGASNTSAIASKPVIADEFKAKPLVSLEPNNAQLARAEGGFLLQCGAFSDFSNANILKLRLLDAGFSDARVILGQDALHRVVLGPLISQDDAEQLAIELADAGFASPKLLVP
jgi:rare lipoprotein A